jgi:hypothetical protein
MRSLLLSLVAAAALCAPATSAILRVKRDAPGPTHDGTTWATAYLKVGDALTASQSGDEVWVAAGTYREAVTLNAGRSLLGGFAGTETSADQRDPSANVTTLTPWPQNASVVTVTTKGSETAVLDGFTITGGNGHWTQTIVRFDEWQVIAYYNYHPGGGIYVVDGAPVISHNQITGNDTSAVEYSGNVITYGGEGGGICVEKGNAVICDNVISNNKGADGGGIAVNGGTPTIYGNTITANNSYFMCDSAMGYVPCNGGGIAVRGGSPAIYANRISSNSSLAGYGGGVYSESAVIRDNVISGNTSTYGGGISQGGGSILRNSIFSNTASSDGGGVRCFENIELADNLIYGNSASGRGGGIAVDRSMASAGSIAVRLLNNTLAGNTAASSGGALAVISTNTTSDTGAVLTNNIVAFNGSGVYASGTAAPTFSHNCVYQNTAYDYQGVTDPTGTNGNIRANPQFKDAANKEYHLVVGSQCIDAGDDSAVTTGDTDLDGNGRIIGAHVDIGCYETAPSAGRANAIRALKIAAGLAAIQPGDLASLDVVAGDSAGKIDLLDVVALLRAANGLAQ